MARYELSAVADDDLFNIFVYGTDQWGLSQAQRYYDGLVAHLDQIAADPFRFPAVEDIRTGLRRSVFKSHANYFMVDTDMVNIRAIQRSQSATHIR